MQSIFQTLLIGVALAMAVLFLFFGDWKGSLVVGVSMPLSVLLAVIVLNFIGYDMNVLTGTGLILAIGMIVDNSIIVLENIYRWASEGHDRMTSCVEGTKEVTLSLTAQRTASV